MSAKKIAVRLHPRLEAEGRGLCDPDDPRNGEVLSARGYGSRGYLKVYPSGFILAKIQSGALLKVEGESRSGAERKRQSERKTGPSSGSRAARAPKGSTHKRSGEAS